MLIITVACQDHRSRHISKDLGGFSKDLGGFSNKLSLAAELNSISLFVSVILTLDRQLRLPAHNMTRSEWRVRIVKQKQGLAVGLKCSELEDGKVFGRDQSRGLVWWMTSEGHVCDGSCKLQTGDLGLRYAVFFVSAGQRSEFDFRCGESIVTVLAVHGIFPTIRNRAGILASDLCVIVSSLHEAVNDCRRVVFA